MNEIEDFDKKIEESKKKIEEWKKKSQNWDMRDKATKEREVDDAIYNIFEDLDDSDEENPKFDEQKLKEQVESTKADYLKNYEKWQIGDMIPEWSYEDFFGPNPTTDFEETNQLKKIRKDFDSNKSLADCVRGKMMADLPEDQDLTQKQKLGKYFGICKEELAKKEKEEEHKEEDFKFKLKTFEDFSDALEFLKWRLNNNIWTTEDLENYFEGI